MKVNEIKRNNFYTDGTNVIFKSKNGKDLLQLTEPEFFERDINNEINFTDCGVDYSYVSKTFFEGKELRKVEKDEILLNGWVKIIDSKNIQIYSKNVTNAKYDSKGYIVNGDELKYEEKYEIVNISKYMF